MPERLRVFVSNSTPADAVALIRQKEPRIDLIWEPELLRPRRRLGDHHGDPAFVRTAEQQKRFHRLVDSADALFGIPDESTEELRRAVLSNPGLMWVQSMAAGGGAQLGAAGLPAARLESLHFTTTAGIHARALTEFALLGILAGAKDLARLQAAQRQHHWEERWSMRMLHQQSAAVVGLGHIGREVARTLSFLGMQVIGVHRREVVVDGVARMIRIDDLAAAVEGADVVVSALPATEATAGIFNARVLGSFRQGATFVNVGRGTVVDEDALIAALRSGRIGFAALDVVHTEPLAVRSQLWDLPNVLISPHTAALHAAEDSQIAELFAANATRLLDGQELLNQVNITEFY